jgi:hypothetical protein
MDIQKIVVMPYWAHIIIQVKILKLNNNIITGI